MVINHRIFLVAKYYIISNVLATDLAKKINLILENIFNMVVSHQIFLIAKILFNT